MAQERNLLHVGEIRSKVGGWDEHWWNLVFDTSSGQFLIEHTWDNIYKTPPDGSRLIPLSQFDPRDGDFQAAIAIITQMINSKASK